MAFTDQCDLFGAVHEDGINRVVRHIMRQRPSLFNYATEFFNERPDLLCNRIDAASKVIKAKNPLFTVQDPIPILGASIDLGLNFCIQFTDLEIDFHPSNAIPLPPELGELAPQRLALHIRACAGLDCPSEELIERLIPIFEILTARDQTRQERRTLSVGLASDSRRKFVLPTQELLCFCLELFGVAHVEWGSVPGFEQPYLKPRLDGLEIVDLQPTPMENMIECYAKTVLRLGILPRLIVPLEKLILDITKLLRDNSIAVGDQINLRPTPAPGKVPHNPAIEEDQLKGFIDLEIIEGGA